MSTEKILIFILVLVSLSIPIVFSIGFYRYMKRERLRTQQRLQAQEVQRERMEEQFRIENSISIDNAKKELNKPTPIKKNKVKKISRYEFIKK